MNPKMTIIDAARFLECTQAEVYSRILALDLSVSNVDNQLYFTHKVATQLFQFGFSPKTIVFQILKGGTGKTSLAFEFAIRASLFGAKVLCIDLDQQGNLTQAFNQDAEEVPVMIDHLAEGYSIFDSLLEVAEGITLLPSRVENALLDEVIVSRQLPLERLYREPLSTLKSFYDFIVVDCPPSLGQSVAAAAMAADLLIAPVTPDKFALSGLRSTVQTLEELEESYDITIPFYVVLNKFEHGDSASIEAWNLLKQNPLYQGRLLPEQIRLSSVFREMSLKNQSIFDSVFTNETQNDIDFFTQSLMGIKKFQHQSLSFQNDLMDKYGLRIENPIEENLIF